MRPADPTLPSIAFVLSQAQPAASTPRNSKRRGRFGVRRTKSSPSMAPHPPRNPPQLDNEFLKVNRISSHTVLPPFCTTFSSPFPLPTLNTIKMRALPIFPPQTDRKNLRRFCDSREKTVDYRFTNPPRAPSRSSFALVSTNYSPGHLRKSQNTVPADTTLNRLASAHLKSAQGYLRRRRRDRDRCAVIHRVRIAVDRGLNVLDGE